MAPDTTPGSFADTQPLAPGASGLAVRYFDGRSARPRAAVLCREHGEAVLHTAEGAVRIAWRDIEWPERTRHGARNAHITSGGSIQSDDGVAWDAWVQAHHGREGWVVRAQQSWRATLVAIVVLCMVIAAGYRWGLPLAASGLLQVVPRSVDHTLGQSTLDSLEGGLFEPSKVPEATQARLRARFQTMVARHQQAEGGPHPGHEGVRVLFRHSRIGPNALALPDGTIVVTDDLVKLLADDEDVLLGVLGHELGHVEARHGMRMVIQSSLLGAVTSLALGDVSGLLAGAPALLGHLHYSRQMEREADDVAIRFLRANALRPSIMVVLFERLAGQKNGGSGEGEESGARNAPRDTSALGIALSSHPADAERIARFRAADTLR